MSNTNCSCWEWRPDSPSQRRTPPGYIFLGIKLSGSHDNWRVGELLGSPRLAIVFVISSILTVAGRGGKSSLLVAAGTGIGAATDSAAARARAWV